MLARLLLLTVLAGSAACADGCGCSCGGEAGSPVVPESASGPTDFDAGASSPSPSRAPTLVAPAREAGFDDEVAPQSGGAEPGEEVGFAPSAVGPEGAAQRVNAPRIQVQPIQPNNLPNQIAPHVAQPRVRDFGGAQPGGVPPETVAPQ